MENKDIAQLTPMMRQYSLEKEKYPDALLFYRLGDFYELFREDAEVASRELGLVLTKRAGVPMCGIPWHASQMYLSKLIKAGYRVAICEQLETPEEAKKRGKCTIERKVTRIVTRGTLLEQDILSDKSNNFLLAISNEKKDKVAISYADVSTGKFVIEEIAIYEITSYVAKIDPVEILCHDGFLSNRDILEMLDGYKSIIRTIPSSKFVSTSAEQRLAKFFGLKFIDSFGELSEQVTDAASMIVDYISEAYKSEDNITLSFPKLANHSDSMYLDNFTRKSLELNTSQSGDKKSSLLYSIDRTQTAQGARMLSNWLREPLTNIALINERLDFVELFIKNRDLLEKISEILSHFPDVERSLSRILMKKAGPRDLRCIEISLSKSMELEKCLKGYSEFENVKLEFDGISDIIGTLRNALTDSLPALVRDGKFIKKGFDPELDEYINILENGGNIIKSLQARYIEETGIQSLKIKSNSVIGYFIEISPNFVSKIPYSFVHRQSLSTSLRYSSSELSDIASKIYSAESNSIRRELLIFDDLLSLVAKKKIEIRKLANWISFIDVTSAFAVLSIDNHYVRPELTPDRALVIKNGRHPVVENNLKNSGSTFVANDCEFSDDVFVSVLTGPNMGGKSTYLRQNALIVIMAQIGSFVPAEFARIGVVDRIFSRVGASDDISSGRSTFMVEMLETASILQNASDRSFVILDEIGRGTSTYDGLAIAWAVVEDIAFRIKSRTIFATHYHELNELKKTVPQIKFLTVKVKEWNNNIMFLHKIESGFSDKSYGINVAALAGFPQHVLDRASGILTNLL